MSTELFEHVERKRRDVERLEREIGFLNARIAEKQDKLTAMQGDIGALERALEVLRRDGVLADADVEATGDGGLVNAIRRVVRELEPPIRTGVVRSLLAEREPAMMAKVHRTSVAGTMRRMAEAGELEVIEKGGPGKEAAYGLPVSEYEIVDPLRFRTEEKEGGENDDTES
jgi:hypothetical protein